MMSVSEHCLANILTLDTYVALKKNITLNQTKVSGDRENDEQT
jgi:hypothetical protein